jgi:hypothetical protein
MSKVLTPLRLEAVDGDTWIVAEPYRCVSDILGPIDIPAGETTDLNSTPRIGWNILPPTEYFHSALPHDFLYKHGAIAGVKISRADADAVHAEFLVFDNAPVWKRRAFGVALRSFGWIAWNKYRRADAKKAAAA